LIIREIVRAKGHENITAFHRSTIEITRENYLTKRGDCIIGVSADKSVKDFDPLFKQYLKKDDTVVIIVFESRGLKDIVLAHGSPDLILNDSNRIIIRKSSYVDGATLCIRANKSARDLDRRLINILRDRNSDLFIKIYLLNINELDREFFNKSVLEIE